MSSAPPAPTRAAPERAGSGPRGFLSPSGRLARGNEERLVSESGQHRLQGDRNEHQGPDFLQREPAKLELRLATYDRSQTATRRILGPDAEIEAVFADGGVVILPEV